MPEPQYGEPWQAYNKCLDMFRPVADHAKLFWLQTAGGSTATLEDCEHLVPRIIACVNALQGIPDEVVQKWADDAALSTAYNILQRLQESDHDATNT